MISTTDWRRNADMSRDVFSLRVGADELAQTRLVLMSLVDFFLVKPFSSCRRDDNKDCDRAMEASREPSRKAMNNAKSLFVLGLKNESFFALLFTFGTSLRSWRNPESHCTPHTPVRERPKHLTLNGTMKPPPRRNLSSIHALIVGCNKEPRFKKHESILVFTSVLCEVVVSCCSFSSYKNKPIDFPKLERKKCRIKSCVVP